MHATAHLRGLISTVDYRLPVMFYNVIGFRVLFLYTMAPQLLMPPTFVYNEYV